MTQRATYQDLSHGITVMDAEYISSDIASLYIVEEDGEVAIIETGTNHSIPYLLNALEAKHLNFDNVRYIIPTHVHLDHAGGAGELMSLCDNADLVIHPFGAAHMIDPSKLIAGASAVYGEDKFKALYGEIKAIDKNRVIQAPDGFKLSMNGREFEFLDTPGHARHHFCIYDKQSNGLFSGDTFGLSYPQLTTDVGRFIFATTTPVQFDPDALLSSIDKIMTKNPEKIYLTHFSEISPTPDIIKQLTDSVKQFKQIALNAIDITEARIELINQNIQHYLLLKLLEMGCHQSREFQQDVIKFDSLLNAQGLDFWLKKYHDK
ncbi:MAG: glyoxylase-like metal-dependent hydrolase (beta-lactamase superfamily II) [Cocleimonas sp.]|jgi:glyoxylase-like metal-dependent hydrolase (beta-lactamase superfamily II)